MRTSALHHQLPVFNHLEAVSVADDHWNSNEKRELTFKEEGQEYAQVLKMLGNGRLEAYVCDFHFYPLLTTTQADQGLPIASASTVRSVSA
jgi:hypothetical protein